MNTKLNVLYAFFAVQPNICSIAYIYRHVFYEGIGLRQLMDYYFVLKVDSGASKVWATTWLKRMGLLRFVAAVMYVEREVYGLQHKSMLCEPDEVTGRCLLAEIMRSGNFGQNDSHIRDDHSSSNLKLYMKNVEGLFGMVRFYPSEVLWTPFWKLWHWSWRKVKNY